MKIEVRNVKINSAFSEETLMFMADVFVDGIKTAYARNDGHGGCTDYNAYEDKRDLLAKAEKFALSLPPKMIPMEGREPLEIKSKLENIIEDLVYKIADEKEKEKANKKMVNAMKKGIIVGVPGARTYGVYNLKAPLESFKKEDLQAAIFRIKGKLNEGEQILNTNLEALGLQS